jgi:hypothetical protein
MKHRREFLKITSAAAIAAAAGTATVGIVRADDGNAKEFLGAWKSIHTLPLPPGFFREYLAFAEGGFLHETNSFLHTASNVDFSFYHLPNAVNASDGFGNWARVGNGVIRAAFRKMLFDGSRQNFGELRVDGTLRSDGTKLTADWHVVVVDPLEKVLLDFGAATSEGTRIL